MTTAMVWVVCGAGRGVGKTHLARRLSTILPDAVCAKQGCGQRRPDGPPNFFQTHEDVADFLERNRETCAHIVLESNEQARNGQGDVIIFIDGRPGTADLRDDREALRNRSDLQVSAAASIRDWKRCLREKLADNSLREAVCDCLMQQQRYLFTGRPEVKVKVWFAEGGMHIFGAGLARLLQHVERHGTLREAAQAASMSYRHAWGLVKNAEKHHGQPLVIPQPGGVGGGQSALTQQGRRLVNVYRRITTQIDALAEECFREQDRDLGSGATVDRQPPESDTGTAADDQSAALQRVEPLRLSTAGAAPVRERGEVAVETPLTITVADVGSFTVLCTPTDASALAVGFAFSEGMILDSDDVLSLSETREPLTVALRLDDPGRVVSQRNLIVTSSCGLCGQRNIDRLLAEMPRCPDTLRVSAALLVELAAKMQARQQLFQHTGGTHAAGIFTAAGELLTLGEDIGRHNALDKAIGLCLLGEQTDARLRGGALGARQPRAGRQGRPGGHRIDRRCLGTLLTGDRSGGARRPDAVRVRARDTGHGLLAPPPDQRPQRFIGRAWPNWLAPALAREFRILRCENRRRRRA